MIRKWINRKQNTNKSSTLIDPQGFHTKLNLLQRWIHVLQQQNRFLLRWTKLKICIFYRSTAERSSCCPRQQSPGLSLLPGCFIFSRQPARCWTTKDLLQLKNLSNIMRGCSQLWLWALQWRWQYKESQSDTSDCCYALNRSLMSAQVLWL